MLWITTLAGVKHTGGRVIADYIDEGGRDPEPSGRTGHTTEFMQGHCCQVPCFGNLKAAWICGQNSDHTSHWQLCCGTAP